MPTAGGQFKARCRFRDYDGVTRLVQRLGKTKSGAQNHLEAALRERQRTGGAQISGETRLKDLGKVWLAEIKANFAAQGNHIVQAINVGTRRRIAVSVHPGTRAETSRRWLTTASCFRFST